MLNTRTVQEILVQLRLTLPSDASSPQTHLLRFQLMLSETRKPEMKWEQKQVAFRKLINYGLRQRKRKGGWSWGDFAKPCPSSSIIRR